MEVEEASVSVCFSNLGSGARRKCRARSSKLGSGTQGGSFVNRDVPLGLVERAQRLQRAGLEHSAAHHNLVQDGIGLVSRGVQDRGWVRETCHSRAGPGIQPRRVATASPLAS
jgi:hypothetical protein